MRTFSLVLLRRLLFRPVPPTSNAQPPPPARSGGYPAPRLSLYDHLSSQTLTTLENLLLHSLSHEPSPKVRRNSVDTVCDVANQGMARGRPWHALQSQAFSMTQNVGNAHGEKPELTRASAYRVFAGAPNLVMDLQTAGVLEVLKKGLEDTDLEVCVPLFPRYFSCSLDVDKGPTCSSTSLRRLSNRCRCEPARSIPHPPLLDGRYSPRTRPVPGQ